MDIISVIKNPIVLGLVACVVVYLYLKWQNDEKYKDDPKIKPSVDITVPAVVGVGVFLLIAGYNRYEKCNNVAVNQLPTNLLLSDVIPFENPTCHLIGTTPKVQIPDVFLEAY